MYDEIEEKAKMEDKFGTSINSTFSRIEKFFTPLMFGIVILSETFHDENHGMKETNWNASNVISNRFHNYYEFYILN